MAAQIGLPDSTHDPDLLGFPLFNVTDYASLGGAANAAASIRRDRHPERRQVHLGEIAPRHEMGLRNDRTRFNQPYYNNNRGTFNVHGAWTGAAWPISCWA